CLPRKIIIVRDRSRNQVPNGVGLPRRNMGPGGFEPPRSLRSSCVASRCVCQFRHGPVRSRNPGRTSTHTREIFGNRRTPTLDVFLRGMAADEGGGGRRRNLSGEPPPTLPLPSRARLYLIGPPQRTATEGRIGNQASDASRSGVSTSASAGSSSG